MSTPNRPRHKHDLDLDYPDFLTWAQLPPFSDEWPMRGWVFLADIARGNVGRRVGTAQGGAGSARACHARNSAFSLYA